MAVAAPTSSTADSKKVRDDIISSGKPTISICSLCLALLLLLLLYRVAGLTVSAQLSRGGREGFEDVWA